MGITGLLPFLEKSSKRTNINEFAGCTVALDSYCWLHKGVFSCADKLSMGQPTDAYVRYCMKFVHMLLALKIKPILVFDGRHLPAKAQTEAKRRESRRDNRKKGAELIRMGQLEEGRSLLSRSLDVTHEMALEVIKECQKINVDCIVAPYEADAQLTYLNISGIADVVVTEDSDLILFGCKKVFFKMKITGEGLLVEQEKLHLAMGTRSEHFDMEKFRYMCILSGCDYLPSLPGIGLVKAKKFVMSNSDCDIHRALTRLGSFLKKKALVVSQEYRDAFILALATFKYQLVYCPVQRKQVRLNPPPPDIPDEQLHYAGKEMDEDVVWQLVLGNCDPFSFKMLHNFDPDRIESNGRRNSWSKKTQVQHVSIWSKDFILKSGEEKDSSRKTMSWPDTVGTKMILQTHQLKKTIFVKKEDKTEYEELSTSALLNTYRYHGETKEEPKTETPVRNTEQVSPVLARRINPFCTQSNIKKLSPSLVIKNRSRVKGRSLSRLKRTIIDEGIVTESKFFSKPSLERQNSFVTDTEASCSPSSSTDVSPEYSEEAERNLVSENINFDALIVSDDMEIDPRAMDVDEEMQDASFASKDRAELNDSICEESSVIPSSQCLDTSKCDSGKSCSNAVAKDAEFSNLNEIDSSISRLDPDPDFLVQRESITSLRSSMFKWANTKPLEEKKCSPRQQTVKKTNSLDSKLNVTNASRRSKQLGSTDRQQSLLSMYGFQKKSNLHH